MKIVSTKSFKELAYFLKYTDFKEKTKEITLQIIKKYKILDSNEENMSFKKILLYILILLFSCTLLTQENQVDDKSVLILFSGSHEFLVNRNMFITFEKVLRLSNIRVVSEYLGDNNSVCKLDKETFFNFFKLKYGENNKFDLVIAFNKEAMDLCIEYGEEIFPDTDILILDLLGQIAYSPPTGLQLDVIQELHKDLKHLLIVSDNTRRGKVLKRDIKAYIDSIGTINDKVIYLDFSEKNYSEIKSYEYYSRGKNVILLLSAYEDISSKKKEYSEQVAFLNRELNLPIYTMYEDGADAEVVGGYYFDIDSMVKQLSIKIMLILNNMPIPQVDFGDMKFYRLFFNQAVADKYELNIQQYRKEAIINKPAEAEKSLIHVIKIIRKTIYTMFVILIALLIFITIRNKKNKKVLLQYRNIASEIFNKSVQYMFFVDTKTKVIIDYNQKVAKSDFQNYIIKNESKITDFFPSQIDKILEQKEFESYSKIHEIDFSAGKKTFPTMLTSLNYIDDQQKLSFIQFLDNSEYKQEMMRLHKLKAEAENRVHESTNLINNFVREIRDPLNVKKGFEELLENKDLAADKKEKYEAIINTNSLKLLTLVEKILMFTELNNNVRILDNHEFSINKCIRKITSTIQQEIKAKGQNTKLVNYFSLSEGKDVLFNDQEYFCLVFKELLDNAVKFTQDGTIECGYTHPNEGKIIFYIKDTGIGMSTNEQREAFNKFNFQSIPNLKILKSGIGVGLAICRNLITKMGGNIWLTSNEGEGTTVYFYLDYDMSVFNGQINTLQQSYIDNLKRKNILIIDEDLGSQKFIIQTLKKYDLEVKTMPNYQFYNKEDESNRQFDFIFFDYSSGFEEFFNNNKTKLIVNNVTLIILTRTILTEEITQELKKIKYTIVYKPLKLQELINSLKDNNG